MENATKALLIAAGVLVVILIISLGVGIFTSASEQMQGTNLNEYEIQKFNDKFTKYMGDNKSAAQVNSLLKVVFNHNITNKDSSLRIRVGLNGGGNNNGTDKAPDKKWLLMREQFYEKVEIPKVSSGKKYKVEAKYDKNSSLIYEIQVWEK